MALEFLRHVFPLGTQGYIRFLTGTPGNFPEQIIWAEVKDLHEWDKLPFEFTDQHQVYFTPHTFVDRTAPADKKNVCETRALWLECDDEDFDPLSITIFPPSVIIQTSPGRTHAYWLLSDAVDPKAVEELNRSMAYKYLVKDRSGWALAKVLRVPGTYNLKRDEPFKVHLLTSKYDRRYSLSDFETLPRIHDPREGPLAELPDRTPEYQEVMDKWRDALPRSVHVLLTVRQADRSKALWRLSNECHRAGLTVEEAFTLLKESPNNKFSDNRFNGDEELWRDINTAYRLSIQVDQKQAKDRINALRSQRGIPPEVKMEEMARLVYRTMAQEGSFYFSPRTAESIYYRTEPHEIMMTLGPKNLDCKTYLCTAYDLNGETKEFKYVAEHLRAWTEQEAPKVNLRDMAFYNRHTGCLYVTDFKGGIYRLDGSQIEHVENGVDGGIFFRETVPSVPYSPIFEHDDPEILDRLMFGRVNMPREEYPEKEARFLIRAWFFSLFFTDLFETRPLLVIEGAAGSGKSVTFKCMEWTVRGDRGQVYKLPETPTGFKEAVRERSHIFFDGVDQPFKGLSELLSTTATGSVDRRRMLYTDNRIVEYQMRCFMGISTMDAHFMRHDVADRSLVLQAQRRAEGQFLPESVIKEEVLDNRNRAWGSILTELNKLVAILKSQKAPATSLRMADFTRVLFAICELHDHDPKWFVSFLKKEQTAQVLKRNKLWDVLRLWLTDKGNRGHPIIAADLHMALAKVSGDNGLKYTQHVRSVQALSIQLNKLTSSVSVSKVPVGDRWGYVFADDQPQLDG